jgi:putative hydrolase of the HAD superfamily
MTEGGPADDSSRFGRLMRPHIIFFDVGDTLLRVHPSWTGVYLEVCRRWKLTVEEPELARAFARALRDGLWEVDGPFDATPEGSYQRIKRFDVRAMELVGQKELPDAFYRDLGRHFERAAAWHVFPDTHATLEGLTRGGIRRAVISNWVWALPELLHDLELAHHFEAIVVSSRVGYQKPQPQIFAHALELAGVPPERAWHVGDNPGADVQGARQLGIQPILIDRERRYPNGLPDHPDVPVLSDLGQLLALAGVASPVL